MSWFKALILGIIQGLTEFLPISSSGHLELGKAIMEVPEESLTFTVVVHAATVCSTIVVFRKDILDILRNAFKFQWNEETQYIVKILLSAVPVLLVGLLLEDVVEGFFNGKLLLVGCMLLITATLLGFTFYAKSKNKEISYRDAFIIGIAQACAVMPGISRSGATIATALLLQNDKEKAARFSFLMVLIPILGKVALDIISGDMAQETTHVAPLIWGFIGAFIFGLIACKLMIQLVKRSKLIYFAIYCLIIGSITIIFSLAG
ncbi:MAG: undecaprenyl-diphosphate phosphatase [Bacteroidales bacterium]|nr:undecaprenyl-diphosphate phosphatase [Bacteroidales bacterium]